MASMPQDWMENNPLVREVVSCVRRIVDQALDANAGFAEREVAALAVAKGASPSGCRGRKRCPAPTPTRLVCQPDRLAGT